MLLAAIILKSLIEVALVVMIGQGILFVLAGAGRHQRPAQARPLLPWVRANRWIRHSSTMHQNYGGGQGRARIEPAAAESTVVHSTVPATHGTPP